MIYEIKTAVFAMENCLSKGLGLQCRHPSQLIVFSSLLHMADCVKYLWRPIKRGAHVSAFLSLCFSSFSSTLNIMHILNVNWPELVFSSTCYGREREQ